jgi:aspartyl-tRNA(Asn)/glutamyl-tRNA(Gln) amidotransferase subunit A
LNAVIALSETAVAEAEASHGRWRAGRPMGPLDGVPVLVKDNLLVAGMPATFGSALYADLRPARDELPIQRLRAAGAILLGKTNCPEFALEGYTANALHGATRNPYDVGLTPGGSSGGSVAAVAAGLCPISIGTDGGGSLRRPAAYTSLFGLKPTVGTVARDQGLPQLLLDYEVVGPLARSVRDLRLVHHVLAKPDRGDPASRRAAAMHRGAGPFRILYAERLGSGPLDSKIAAACGLAAQRFEGLGHTVVRSTLPFDLGDLNARWPMIGQVALAHLRQRVPEFGSKAGRKYVEWADRGDTIPARELYGLLEQLQALRGTVSAAFANWDAIMTPSCAAMPWPATEPFPAVIDGQEVGPRGHAIYTAWVNAAHHPAIAVPANYSPDGLPIGFQLVGDLGAEGMLLDLAEAYEKRFLPHRHWPDLAMA